MKDTMSVPQIINDKVCESGRVANLINWYRAHNSNIQIINNIFCVEQVILGIVQLDCLELGGMAFEDIVKIQCDFDNPSRSHLITLWDKDGKSVSFVTEISVFRLRWWWGFL